MPEGAYALSFNADNTLIERKNASGCGTPPVTYGDYNGNWSEQDSIVHIQVGFWGGQAHLEWEIIAIDDQQLEVLRLAEEYDNP